MIHHRTFANLALVSNMLVAGPALTLIAGIISQLDAEPVFAMDYPLEFSSL